MQLVGEIEAPNVEGADIQKMVQAVEGQLRLAQLGAEIGPGQIGPVGEELLRAVHAVVEDLEPLVAHAEFIRVRIGKDHPRLRRKGVPAGECEFPSDIAPRLLHPNIHAPGN